MYRRWTLCSIDPFSPYRPDLAPRVMLAMERTRAKYLALGRDPVAGAKDAARVPHQKLGILIVVLRHLSVEDGGECIDTTRRVAGRQLDGALMVRVARRLGMGVPRAWAILNLTLLPGLPPEYWDSLDGGNMSATALWDYLLDHPEVVEAWSARVAGEVDRPERG